MSAEVLRRGALDMHVCVPAGMRDEEVVAFAEKECPCGTSNGWQIRRQGDPALAGANERTRCAAREAHEHIVLDA